MSNILSILALLVSMVSLKLFAIPENSYVITYNSEVVPFDNAVGKSHFFKGENNKRVHFRSYINNESRNSILISPGRTESVMKYAELAFDLYSLGYSVFVIDHRGQGLSERMTDDREMGHIDSFNNYILDFDKFVKLIKEMRPSDSLNLIAHSMGGAIAALYIASDIGKDSFSKAVFSSPMLKITTKPFPRPFATALSGLLSFIGMKDSYAPGKRPYSPNYTFEENDLTHSRTRFNMSQAIFKQNRELAIGGPSNYWVYESLIYSSRARRSSDKIEIPILLLEAGKDKVVKVSGEEHFCDIAKSCKEIIFENSYHEILMEIDAVRDESIDQIVRFFTNWPLVVGQD